MKLTFGSLFAGVGGFDQGFDRASMECRWQVEWDKNCQKLLQRKWPNARHYEDITTVRAGELERVDVICGGSPCQDLSVAGKRAGMAGGRSGLFHEMVRICKRVRPRFVVWENVDGAFSSNEGRDFASVLRAFTGLAVEVPADGWGRAGFIKTPFPEWRWNCAWRLFDAQYFGVPQRRRRVFLVASLGDGSCAEILFEPESLRGDSPPSRGARERIAGSISARTEGGGGLGTDFEIRGGCARSLTTGSGGGRYDKQPHVIIPEVADCLQERDSKGADSSTKTGHLLPIAFSSKDHGADAGEISPTLRACPHDGSHANGGGPPAIAFHPTQDPISSTDGSTHALGCGSKQGQSSVAIAFKPSHFTRGKDGPPDEIAPPLSADADKGDQEALIFHMRMAVRRLTPLECERLMGWPEVENGVIFSACFAHQKNSADAADPNLRSPLFVPDAVQNHGSTESASFVNTLSPSERHPHNAVARWRAEINVETRCVVIARESDECSPSVSFAVSVDTCDRLVRDALIVLGRVNSLGIAAKGQPRGKGAKAANETPLTQAANGKCCVAESGRETAFASDAQNNQITVSIHDKDTSTTSVDGLTFQNSDSCWITLCSSVAHAIFGFTQGQTPSTSSFDCAIIVRAGYTFGFADSVRYKMCGNGVVATVSEWIGRRIVRHAT